MTRYLYLRWPFFFFDETQLDQLLQSVLQLRVRNSCVGRYKYLVIGRHTSYFAKQKHSDSTKRFSETYIINMSEFFLLTTSLLCLVDVFFKRQLTCLWVQTVLLLSPTCSFIRMKQISYRGFSRKTKRS
jgi:hypothetical protein